MTSRFCIHRPTPLTASTLLALIICVTLLLPGATSAQPVLALDQTVAIGNQTAEESPAIPANFLVTPILRPVVETMWHQSPTFKAQCARLRQAPSLLVKIHFGGAPLGAGRGRTDFVRSSRHTTRADIYIDLELRSVDQLVELIAHELEHVIEQLDEVKLTPADRHGVYLTAGGAFETARAIHIGQKVSGEVSGAMHSVPRLRPR